MKLRHLSLVLCAALCHCASVGPCAGQTFEPEPSGPFCGINCLYTALRTEGVHVDLSALMQSKYVGSESGSTFNELVAAATDNHAYAQVVGNLSLSDLNKLDGPAILHVKSSYDAIDYDHFILCVAVRGQLHFYDPPNQTMVSSGHELAGLWDGTAVIVSAAPVHLGLVRLRAVGRVIFAMVMMLGPAALGLLVGRRWAERFGEAIFPRQTIAQGVVVIVIGTGLATGYHLLAPEGFFAQRRALAIINRARFEPPPETVDLREALRLQADGAVFIDARRTGDFVAGHVDGAVNLPPDSSPSDVEHVLKRANAANGFVVYCASPTCPFAAQLARRLRRYGYTNLKIFSGGWSGWHAAAEDHSASVGLVVEEGL